MVKSRLQEKKEPLSFLVKLNSGNCQTYSSPGCSLLSQLSEYLFALAGLYIHTKGSQTGKGAN